VKKITRELMAKAYIYNTLINLQTMEEERRAGRCKIQLEKEGKRTQT